MIRSYGWVFSKHCVYFLFTSGSACTTHPCVSTPKSHIVRDFPYILNAMLENSAILHNEQKNTPTPPPPLSHKNGPPQDAAVRFLSLYSSKSRPDDGCSILYCSWVPIKLLAKGGLEHGDEVLLSIHQKHTGAAALMIDYILRKNLFPII